MPLDQFDLISSFLSSLLTCRLTAGFLITVKSSTRAALMLSPARYWFPARILSAKVNQLSWLVDDKLERAIEVDAIELSTKVDGSVEAIWLLLLAAAKFADLVDGKS
jgi:hypothetical protein